MPQRGLGKTRSISLRNCNKGGFPIQPHPAATKPFFPKKCLSFFHCPQNFRRQGNPADNPGGKTGFRRKIPTCQRHFPADTANLILDQAGLHQRHADTELLDGPQARTIPGKVVNIGSVQQNRCFGQQRKEPGINSLFTEVTTIRSVSNKIGPGKRLAIDNAQRHAEPAALPADALFHCCLLQQ